MFETFRRVGSVRSLSVIHINENHVPLAAKLLESDPSPRDLLYNWEEILIHVEDNLLSIADQSWREAVQRPRRMIPFY